MTDKYIVKIAKGGPLTSGDRLEDVLAECPEDYRLHSVVPIASSGGYTLRQQVIFERKSSTP